MRSTRSTPTVIEPIAYRSALDATDLPTNAMPVFPEVVPCHRLAIRTWTPDDVVAIRTAIAQSAELLRPWMSFMSEEPMTDSNRKTQIAGWERQRRRGEDTFYGVFDGDTVIGGCTLHKRAAPDTVGLGYWIHIDHIGNGHASTVAACLTTVALSLPGVTRVEIHHDAANSASRRIPQTLGFNYDGERSERPVAPNEIGVDVAWSTTSTTWLEPPDQTNGPPAPRSSAFDPGHGRALRR